MVIGENKNPIVYMRLSNGQQGNDCKRTMSTEKIASTYQRTEIVLFGAMNILGFPLVAFVLSAAVFLGIFALEVTASTLASINIF